MSASYYTTRAIVIDQTPWREIDVRLEVCTAERGLQEYLVRSGRSMSSKLRPHALVFDRTILTVATRGGAKYITQARLEQRLQIDSALLTRQRAAAVACALVRLARTDLTDAPRLFRALDSLLIDINQRRQDFLIPLLALVTQILELSGVVPLLGECQTCHRRIAPTDTLVFALGEGAIFHQICSHPFGSEPLPLALWSRLCAVLASNTIGTDQAVFQWLVRFAKYHLEAKNIV